MLKNIQLQKNKFKQYIPQKLKLKLKKAYRKFKQKNRPKLTKDDFINTLNQLGLSKGDTVIVHSSFGYLNIDISPTEVIQILKNIITTEGNILMPYYPPKLGYNWLNDKEVFDVNTTKSSMGVLTNLFSKSEGVKISLHPIKAMAVWGKNRDQIIATHHESSTPFDKKSPYYIAGELPNSKSLGLGIERNAYFHCCEDIINEHDNSILYSSDYFESKLIDNNQHTIKVNTYAHCPSKTHNFISPTDYLKKTNCKSYNVLKNSKTRMYIVNNKEIKEHLQKQFKQGVNRKTLK